MIDINLPSMANIQNATGKELRQISEYLQQLSEQLRYELSHVDDMNMTAETVSKLNKTADNSGTVTLQQFVAGLRIALNGTTLTLKSGNIELNNVGLASLTSGLIGTSEAQDAAFEALYPIGTIYTTANTTDPITDILPFDAEWQEVTPAGETGYKQYKRIEPQEA